MSDREISLYTEIEAARKRREYGLSGDLVGADLHRAIFDYEKARVKKNLVLKSTFSFQKKSVDH